jgi:glycosyltransferase involved in cell wall biosynthesis
MKDLTLTIITPTYNRAHLLHSLFKSLNGQTNKNFIWMIIDDGSTDETEKLIREFTNISNFKIIYFYQLNQGKHSAINYSLDEVFTDLVFVVDSDDFLTFDAVEKIYFYWKKFFNSKTISALWFLQMSIEGIIVGKRFKEFIQTGNYVNTMINSGYIGDKRAVYKTIIRKKFMYPVHENEKFIGESLVHKKISEVYESVFINEVIYIGNYLKGGLTDKGFKMRLANPKGGYDHAKEFLTKDIKLKYRIKKSILLTVYGHYSGKKFLEMINQTRSKLLFFLLYPLSILFVMIFKIMYKDQRKL